MLDKTRTQQIEQAIAAQEAAGQSWTNQSIYNAIGGNYSELSQYLKARRAQAQGAEGVAVAVAEAARLASLRTPLARARWQRDQTAQDEFTLVEQEQALKEQRRALDNQRQQLEINTLTGHTDAADLERRRQARTVITQRLQVEEQRLAVHRQRLAAHETALLAADQYAALQGQAARWLRQLRAAQRQTQAGGTAQERGDAREEAETALRHLAALVGQAEAEALAADARLSPDWLRS